MDGRRPGQQAVQYKQLLEALNEVAHLEVNNWLKEQSNLSEPYAARRLSQLLPSGHSQHRTLCTSQALFVPCYLLSGLMLDFKVPLFTLGRLSLRTVHTVHKHVSHPVHRYCAIHFCWHDLSRFVAAGNGLFIGNSMPIRDMDMYAAWQQKKRQQGQVSAGSGCPVGSNRGASGIDGVLSTAAGFAAGLKRPVTLVVGDVSFLHDINGLNLLRTGQCSRECISNFVMLCVNVAKLQVCG